VPLRADQLPFEAVVAAHRNLAKIDSVPLEAQRECEGAPVLKITTPSWRTCWIAREWCISIFGATRGQHDRDVERMRARAQRETEQMCDLVGITPCVSQRWVAPSARRTL
jgi:hypothetical protein